MTTRLQREEGMAVIIALMAMMLMTALGMSLVLTTTSETMISGNFRSGGEALYAADAILERSMDDLLTIPDWNKLLDGSMQSGFIDGPPSGDRTLPDGTKVNLGEILSFANCEKAATCSEPDMNAYTEMRSTSPEPQVTNTFSGLILKCRAMASVTSILGTSG